MTLHTASPFHETATAGSSVHSERLRARLDSARLAAAPRVTGRVERVIGLRFDVAGLDLPLGGGVRVLGDDGLAGEVVGCGDGGA
jgi:hypothetical protein